jgi:3-deoxy-D-manno-octulosonic-acid transferase
MRTLYSLLLYLLTPVILLYLAFRGLRGAGYLGRWAERFGFFNAPPESGGILVHSASMGEVNAAAPLIRELIKRYPASSMSLTAFTPTGSDRIRELFGPDAFHVYSPLDLPGAVKRFFDRVRPKLMIIMETEIWPNLYHEAWSRGIPIVIVNARISDRSIGGYRRLSRLTEEALGRVSEIGAQGELDAARLVEIGADANRVAVTGNLKFDVNLPPSLLEQGETIRMAWGAGRLVFLAGSTHEGDEGPVLEAFQRVLPDYPNSLLVLVPRHPERFSKVAQMARAAGLRVARRTEGVSCPQDAQCFLIDTMGELLKYYAASDIAFVGGSLDAIGGHNVLEPAALAKPVIVGPHTFNFADITKQLIECGAAIRVQDTEELESAIRRLFGEPELRDRMGLAALDLVRSGQGALERTLELIAEVVSDE